MHKHTYIRFAFVLLLLLMAVRFGYAQTSLGDNKTPLQFSTHTYSVTMGNANDQVSWRIYKYENTFTDATLVNVLEADIRSATPLYTPLIRNTDYVVKSDKTVGGTASIQIEFSKPTMPVGDYVLVYMEAAPGAAGDEDCSSIAVYKFSLKAPIDAGIALSDGEKQQTCPDITGTPQEGNTSRTTTEYKVTLAYPNAASNERYAGVSWYFRYTVKTEGQGGASATIHSVRIKEDDATYSTVAENINSSSYTNTYTAASASKQIFIEVIYNDQLGVQQVASVEVTEVEGTYFESERTTDNNKVSQTFYAMPNLGTISALN